MTPPSALLPDFDVLSETLSDGTALITVVGESDMYTAPELERELSAAVERGAADVIVDLTATTFFDSTNLAVLLRAAKRARSRGGRLAIVSSNRNVTTVFRITGLDRVLSIHRSLAAARDAALTATAAQAR